MDFSKAFDKVCHNKHLAKQDFYRVRSDILNWTSCFLDSRQQCVVVDGEQSPYLPVLSGVPQSSVVGPIMFLVYINDLPEYVQSNVHLLVDDVIMYLAIHSEDQCAQLQSDLDNLQSWEKDWLMEFSSDKCEVLRVTRKKSMIHHDYTFHGKVLRSATSARYLGVQLSHDFKWNSHISNVSSKANRTLGFLKRNLRVNELELKQKAYVNLVRPQLEYYCSVWDRRRGFENNGSYRVEIIQRRAARWTLARFHLLASVTEMLNELGWRSLEERRIDARLVLMYKIVQGILPVSCSNLLRPALRRSRNKHSFLPIVCNTSSHYLSFFPRTINQWNSIPSNILTNCNTTDTFRQRVSLLSHSSNV